MRLKRWVVRGLDSVCGVLHHVPMLRNHYRCNLAHLAERLQRRWGVELQPPSKRPHWTYGEYPQP